MNQPNQHFSKSIFAKKEPEQTKTQEESKPAQEQPKSAQHKPTPATSSKANASYKELISFFKSKIVFLFDIEPIAFGLPVNFPHYQAQAFASTSFLFSPSLKKLQNDKLQKSKLWVCLRRLFNV